jgi:hypothetical protein
MLMQIIAFVLDMGGMAALVLQRDLKPRPEAPPMTLSLGFALFYTVPWHRNFC